MPKINLRARGVAALKAPEGGQVDYWDTNLPGFGIRVSYGGRKSWIVMYRAGGRKRRLTLGTFPQMELAKAREQARAVQLAAIQGGDPAAEKLAARKVETFEELAQTYVERYAKPNKKSWRLDERALKRDVVPTSRADAREGHSPARYSGPDPGDYGQGVADPGEPNIRDCPSSLQLGYFRRPSKRKSVRRHPEACQRKPP